jgi:hypothetical protein
LIWLPQLERLSTDCRFTNRYSETETGSAWGTRSCSSLNILLRQLHQITYDEEINDAKDVMAFVDSPFNANIKVRAAHHIVTNRRTLADHNLVIAAKRGA